MQQDNHVMQPPAPPEPTPPDGNKDKRPMGPLDLLALMLMLIAALILTLVAHLDADGTVLILGAVGALYVRWRPSS